MPCAADVLNVDGDGLEKIWADAAASKDLLKFGGGFYIGKLRIPLVKSSAMSALPPITSDVYVDLPMVELTKSYSYGGIDALALPTEFDDSEKMLLFPESVIKTAVDTLKEIAIDDFKAEQYERAVKHLTVGHPPAVRSLAVAFEYACVRAAGRALAGREVSCSLLKSMHWCGSSRGGVA